MPGPAARALASYGSPYHGGVEAPAQSGHARCRYPAILVLALVLLGCTPATPDASTDTSEVPASQPASASATAESSATPAEAAEPILQALEYLPIGARVFEFTDWVSVKASLGVPELTSAAPDDERETFARSLSAVGASDTPFTFIDQRGFVFKTLLTTWGFDNLDLDWEASIHDSSGIAYALRLRDGFDLAPVLARLDERGFATSVIEGVTVRTHEMANEDWVFAGDFAFLNVALMPDGRTLVVSRLPEALELVLARRGQLLGPDAPPVVLDAVAALEHPSGAFLGFVLDALCDPAGPNAQPIVQELLADVGPLHAYTLVAVGYRADLDPAGRIVFGYVDPADATADVDGRRRLATEGLSLQFGEPIRNRLFSVVDAIVEEGSLILRVGPPVIESPQPGVAPPTVPSFLLRMTSRYDMIFAACDFSL